MQKKLTLSLLWFSLIVTGGFAASFSKTHRLDKQPKLINSTISKAIEPVFEKIGKELSSGKGKSLCIRPAQQLENIPWSVDFSQSNLSDFTIIDANEDEITWRMGSGVAEAPYSPKDQMDDWLITPPLAMNSGMPYTVTLLVAANSASYDERLEICYGSENSVEGMIQTALEPTDISGTEFCEIEGVIVPNKTGGIYIGIHGISDPDMYKILLKEIRVSAGAEGNMPAGVSELTITPGNPYDLTAELSFNAPSYTMSGEALTEISKIEIARNDELIKTIENPAPGSAQSYTDNVPQGDDYTYAVTAFNNAGAGFTMKENLHVGGAAPDAPEEVHLEEISDGTMKLSWSPVTTDMDGNTIPEGMVRYIVVDTSMYPIVTDYADTQVVFSITSEEQTFVECMVAAYTPVGGLGDARLSNVLAVGPAYDGATYSESFANGDLETIIGVGYEFGYVDYVGWDIATDDSFDNSQAIIPVVSSDGDNGFVFMQCEYRDTGSSLFTGKMKLPEDGVAVKFDIFNQSLANIPDQNLIEVMVTENGEDWEIVDSATVYDFCGNNLGWNEVTVGLQKYAGKTIQLRWQITIESFAQYLMDNIRIVGLPAQDLGIRNFKVPQFINSAQEETAQVEVLSFGEQNSGNYDITIYANDYEIAKVYQSGQLKGEKRIVEIPFRIPPVLSEDVELYAEVYLADDENTTNNRSRIQNVHLNLPKTPYITDLKGSVGENGLVTLNWSAPLVESYTPGENEGFESGEDFSHSFGDWIFLDVDAKPIGGLTPSIIPGVEPGETTASFMVFNQTQPSFTSGLHSHSGDKYLASLFNYYGDQNDDWAITPELNGSAQVVSFWARSLSSYYPESMEILYSFGGTQPSDFIKIVGIDNVPETWTEYQIPIPAGAKRFAVRHVSSDQMALLLDDFFFADASKGVGLEIEGYNIYCDARSVGEVSKDAETFSHIGTNGERSYRVTARYAEQGESRGSNEVLLTVTNGNSGVNVISNDGLGILKQGNVLRVVGHSGETLEVFGADGICKHKQNGLSEDYQVELPSGLYIVKAGNSVRKIKI